MDKLDRLDLMELPESLIMNEEDSQSSGLLAWIQKVSKITSQLSRGTRDLSSQSDRLEASV